MKRHDGLLRSALLAVSLLASVPAGAAADVGLIEAARQRRWADVRTLSKTVDVNVRQPDGATALLWAAQWDHVPTAELLVAAGADANLANDYGITPLFFAVTNGSEPMVALLLAAGADPNTTRPTGETALMTAARSGNPRVVEALLDRGAGLEASEHDLGQTALMWAVAEQHDAVVRLLVDRGAAVGARSKSGYTPLLFAARQGSHDTVRLLLARGAGVNEAAADGTTALLMATVRGHLDLALDLLNAGADPNASGTGYTPLHWAAGTWESATTRDYRVREWTALPGLSGEARVRLVNALLAHGADPNARASRNPPRFGSSAWKVHGGGTAFGATPFFYAAMSGDVETMRLLLAHGADASITTGDGTTALIAGAGLGVEESETRIPESRHFDAVRLLLDLGADVGQVNGQGNTPLHGAAFLGYDSIVRLLVGRGAELNARNHGGLTPYRIALGIEVTQMFFQHPETAELIKSLGGIE
ncbi:MAG: hypothetical protein FJW23_09850 [Acidimicrobiia bacterium]|nr:hypothetical protein [Acidimicrobiia bacterium]